MKSLIRESWDNHSKPHYTLHSVQWSMGNPDAKHYVHITSAFVQVTSWKCEDGLYEPEYQEICIETISQRNDSIKKFGAMTIWMDMLM